METGSLEDCESRDTLSGWRQLKVNAKNLSCQSLPNKDS
jgi:hypothetical protein